MIGYSVVANRTLKARSREYADWYGVPYPRALADLTAPGLSVPLNSKIPRERMDFDPAKDRHLILTGDFELRAGCLERVFGRFSYKPHVECFIIDVTGDLARAFSDVAEDGSEGAAMNPTAATMLLESLVAAADDPTAVPADQFDVIAVHGLSEMLEAAPESAGILGRLLEIDSPQQCFVLAGDWIGNCPVPGGPKISGATRLHHGPLGDLTGLSAKNQERWRELDPAEGDVVYQKRGYVPIKGTARKRAS
ncbi:hypothetical protein [Pseudarthrobacter sp. BIM B-2242]|uniref:hypothetical protein n=1 Tax=Pseudarthrobacter sp. BIM B-2242 TaxID=2772401 RepID=UPI00168BA274|nr:hypothetical protein [Pseudarthrobacter sp. BIM B-2242]QOD05821.1 hypothetical protein IDT60_22775 [Pseudarthrobacter sp. BIM B-2242]